MCSIMKYVSIDIGIQHMGVVYAEIKNDYTIDFIISCELVDIEQLCKLCTDTDCLLHHSNYISDYMTHFFKKFPILETADTILVEQQPPMGWIVIQEIIRFQYREKVISVSPSSVHFHFSINRLNYEQRKKATQDIANKYLIKFDDYKNKERKHDMSDGLCQLVFYLSKKNADWINQKKVNLFKNQNKHYIESLKIFEYKNE